MTEITYTRCGDYLLPDITLQEPPKELAEPITKYGAIRRVFLREHRTITYNRLLLTERLFPHLREIQKAAHKRIDSIMSSILALDPPPDKAADSFAWAAHMTQAHYTAERIMLDEVVYQ